MIMDGPDIDPNDGLTSDPRSGDTSQQAQSWGWFGLVVILVILLILMLLPKTFFNGATGGGGSDGSSSTAAADHTVPDVVGLSLSQAAPRVAVASLRLVTDTSPTASPGSIFVVSQSPAPGTRLPENGEVRVTIQQPDRPAPTVDASVAPSVPSTSGPVQVRVPEYVTVPDVTGMSKSEAEAAAREAGLTPYVLLRPTGLAPDGQAFDQQPAAGTTARKGSELTIAVALRN